MENNNKKNLNVRATQEFINHLKERGKGSLQNGFDEFCVTAIHNQEIITYLKSLVELQKIIIEKMEANEELKDA
jgi:hypothetical protein